MQARQSWAVTTWFGCAQRPKRRETTSRRVSTHQPEWYNLPAKFAEVLELADRTDLGSVGATREGSTPSFRTQTNAYTHEKKTLTLERFLFARAEHNPLQFTPNL